jgi:hypothetical protein
MRQKIRSNDYVMTLHAEEEMEEEGLTIFDVERAILIGEIVERQRDRQTAESKYRLRGASMGEEQIEVIAKLSLTGKLMTVYTLE